MRECIYLVASPKSAVVKSRKVWVHRSSMFVSLSVSVCFGLGGHNCCVSKIPYTWHVTPQLKLGSVWHPGLLVNGCT